MSERPMRPTVWMHPASIAVGVMAACGLVACGGGGKIDRTPVVGDQGASVIKELQADLDGDGLPEKVTILSTANPTVGLITVGARGRLAFPLLGPGSALTVRAVTLSPSAKHAAIEVVQPLIKARGARPEQQYRYFTFRAGSIIATPQVDAFAGAKPVFPGDGTVVFSMRRCAAGGMVQTRMTRLRYDPSTGFLLIERQRNRSEPGDCP